MIRLENVSFSYAAGGIKTKVLNDISLNIHAGESVAIVGPSGSGKSTLLHLISCFQKIESGKIFIDGVDASTLNDFERALVRNQKIGFVFQQFHLLPKASILDNILLPTTYPCETRKHEAKYTEKAKQLAETFGLADHIAKKPNQLSGGQQQRVAITRALINDAEIILADEPTGNLDSKNAAQVVDLLKALNAEGKTVVVITHDMKVAQQFDRIYEIQDGKITFQHGVTKPASERRNLFEPPRASTLLMLTRIIPLTFENMRRHKLRSWLTMIGIAVGVAAVLAASTLGSFTKDRMIASYTELGVNTINFLGFPNFNLTAMDDVPAVFRSFEDERDLKPLKRIFPQIKRIAPQTQLMWSNTVTFGGKSLGPNVAVAGVGHQYFQILKWELTKGRAFTPYHIEAKSPSCIIGADIERGLFRSETPLNKLIHISDGNRSYVCKIIGVLKESRSNKPWDATPNLKVYLPHTFFMTVSGNFWDGVQNFLAELDEGSSVEKIGNGIKNFFAKRYGKSGEFFLGFDATMVEQMNKFLNLFTLIITSIALICLAVGGVGIANMMLVSLSERYKEIGLRKAVGATNASIRMQFLLESLFLCMIAGLIGITFGFVGYEGAIYAASKVVPKLRFEWVFDVQAISLSFLSIVIVGFLSGIIPALKAEKLEIAEALRAE